MKLSAVITEITRLGSEFNPLHARRLEAFGVKRGRDEHSAFVHKVEMCLNNADFKSMTRDQLDVYLFLRDADASMAKIATKFLQLDPMDQSMADFKTPLRETENSPWYGTQKNGDTQNSQRWCAACSSATHNESSCSGVCKHCSGHGHREEKCR